MELEELLQFHNLSYSTKTSPGVNRGFLYLDLREKASTCPPFLDVTHGSMHVIYGHKLSTCGNLLPVEFVIPYHLGAERTAFLFQYHGAPDK
jgi:hypothetical protein